MGHIKNNEPNYFEMYTLAWSFKMSIAHICTHVEAALYCRFFANYHCIHFPFFEVRFENCLNTSSGLRVGIFSFSKARQVKLPRDSLDLVAVGLVLEHKMGSSVGCYPKSTPIYFTTKHLANNVYSEPVGRYQTLYWQTMPKTLSVYVFLLIHETNQKTAWGNIRVSRIPTENFNLILIWSQL